MSRILLEFVRSFVSDKLTAEVFSDAYIELWKIERDFGFLLRDDPVLSEFLSSVFCVADIYCADDDLRDEYEIDSDQLKDEILTLFNELEVNRPN